MNPIYQENYVDNPDYLLEKLMQIDWLQATEARKEYFMSDKPRNYTYGSGVGIRTYQSQPYIQEVLDIQNKISLNDRPSYNVCFLNRYDNQKNHLGWHADDSVEMDQTHPIAVVSLGIPRYIWWKLQSDSGAIPDNQKQLLYSGSLFVMPAGFQDKYYHRIPKHDRDCGIRISLTFRRYKE